MVMRFSLARGFQMMKGAHMFFLFSTTDILLACHAELVLSIVAGIGLCSKERSSPFVYRAARRDIIDDLFFQFFGLSYFVGLQSSTAVGSRVSSALPILHS
ncbi:uncharacterized protein EDB91DRAFT_1122380 [Suillus paluster]|uniref:uncharacterized protein n=1 Tax=Suillus paluster TaxID=48578 RepID=UPI001B881574|nr:uncharacterized protein EDB91DRAFT_1122380 [Suillus paluster]KAG1745088.1 hypothetical protein EDB91DRAFT_1122380 [Suillus paluster]